MALLGMIRPNRPDARVAALRKPMSLSIGYS
jgi:hypothetical protein